jgi:hypothetical protein
MRAFGPAGEPVGAEHAANPGTPGDHVAPDIALTAEGTVWVGWTTPGNLNPSGDGFESVLSLRPFDLAGDALAGAQDVAQAGFAVLTGGRGGALVTWRSGPGGSSVVGFVVGPAGGQSGPPSAPFAIEGAELTDFRAWVRFSAASWGTPLEPCLAQALCAAGLLPTRAEVIVRVIGPSANGFLWPQIVRFTTDQGGGVGAAQGERGGPVLRPARRRPRQRGVDGPGRPARLQALGQAQPAAPHGRPEMAA